MITFCAVFKTASEVWYCPVARSQRCRHAS
jgi:hypothetical protein